MDDLQGLIKPSLTNGREGLRQSSIRLLAETNERMLAEGVPVEIVAIMSARIMGRLMGRPCRRLQEVCFR